MITGPKYKIARKLGAPVFEKTQTQKYAQHLERKSRVKKSFAKPKSEYAFQHNEKQKARMVYGVSEKQFSKYVKESLTKKASRAALGLFELLEMRLDNIVARISFSPTHRGARQMVSHGHILVNDRKVKVPSRNIKIGDKISVREGSKASSLFTQFDERFKNVTIPPWIKFDAQTKTAEIIAFPKIEQADMMFSIPAIIEFYSR